ncbi:peptidase C1-like family protein [gut metagenome]|uniref:Peptidase C1-like family protein n=1 Tax=gut metagenome TaxID=749906 RepID=J9GMC6_9ZZZZ
MKKTLLVALAAACLVPGSLMAKKKKTEPKKEEITFTVIKENPVTSIKDQNQSGTCWAYSSLGFLEAELLRMGKGTHDLCEAFLVYNTYMDRADKAVRTHGDVSFSQGGSFYDAAYCLKHYGIVPETAMPAPGTLYGDSLFNFNQLDAVTSAYVGALAKGNHKKLSLTWKSDLFNIYKNYFGELPKEVKAADGKTYTPQAYAKDYLGLNMDDYVSLTSYTHHPFYSKFILEIQDNWRWAESYNLPLDEFMRVMDSAVRNGYTFAWGSDVTETYFGRQNGKDYAYVPKNLKVRDLQGSDAARWGGTLDTGAKVASDEEMTITQDLRQKAYDNWETTDDHGMVIYGLAKDDKGTEYFMVKNSWGDYGKYHGMFYASKAYVAYKTMNIFIHKSAIPADIAKKLGL